MLSSRPDYDRSDPDYQGYAEIFERLQVRLSMYGATANDVVDFSQLNNGEWKVACLLGGYANPLEEMQKLGANIDPKDRSRLTEAGKQGFRLAQVEEYEMMIAYVDSGDRARFIHFANGLGPEGKRFRRCISKPEARIVLGR